MRRYNHWQGKKFSKEHRENISKGNMGMVITPEHRAKISKANKGRVRTPEWREKIRATMIARGIKPAVRFVGPQSAEANEKRRAWNKNNLEKLRYWKDKKQPQEMISKRMKNNPMKGSTHWAWKGGISPLNRKLRALLIYRQWRSDVFTRDNFTCVLCDARGVYLEADHFPKQFYKIIEEYRIKNSEQALRCEEMWNINNGRTLCQPCHKKYGKRKETNL